MKIKTKRRDDMHYNNGLIIWDLELEYTPVLLYLSRVRKNICIYMYNPSKKAKNK